MGKLAQLLTTEIIKTVTMEDKIKKILEEYKVYGAKQDLITEKLLVLFSVSNSLDLVELERKIDKALDNETSESLKEWLHNKRL